MENIINDKDLDKLDFEELEDLLDGFDLDSVQYDFIEQYIVRNFRNVPEKIFDGTRFVGHKASEKWERIIKTNSEKRNEENVSILLSDIFSILRRSTLP